MTVRKRDGREEKFSRNKIFSSLLGATATPEEAEKVVVKLEQWMADNQSERISVRQIRVEVVNALEKLSPSAAKLYENYDREK